MNRTSSYQTDIKVVGWATCVICTGGLVSNAFLFLPFVRSRSLLTPFNLYIINLAVANILRLISVLPFPIYYYIQSHNLYPGHSCNFSTFSTFFFTGILLNLHALIAANRTWAIIHPLSYRVRHSIRWSIISCSALWLGTFLVQGLYPIMSRFLGPAPRDPSSVNCLESLRNFPPSTQLILALGFTLPMSVILLSFPVILIAACRRDSKKRRLPGRQTRVLPGPTLASTAAEKQGGGVTAALEAMNTPDISRHKATENKKKQASEKYLLLSLLTASVAICTLPYFSYYMVQSTFRSIKIPASMPAVTNLLYQCQAFVDVMLFLMSMRDLRAALWKCLKRTVCR